MNRWARWAAAACWLAAFAATPVTTRALDNSDRLLGWWDERTKDDVKTTTCFRILNASGQDILLSVEFLGADENPLPPQLERRLTKNRDLEELCVEDLLAAGLINLGAADHGTVDFRAVDAGDARTPVAAIVGFQKELFYRSVQRAVDPRTGRPLGLLGRTLVAASEANLKSAPRPLLRPLPPKLIVLPIVIRLEGSFEGEPFSVVAQGTARVNRGLQTGETIPIEIVALDLRGVDRDGTPVTVDVRGEGKIVVWRQDREGTVREARLDLDVGINMPILSLGLEGSISDVKMKDPAEFRGRDVLLAPMYLAIPEDPYPYQAPTFVEAWLCPGRVVAQVTLTDSCGNTSRGGTIVPIITPPPEGNPPPGGITDPRITTP